MLAKEKARLKAAYRPAHTLGVFYTGGPVSVAADGRLACACDCQIKVQTPPPPRAAVHAHGSG